MRKHFLAIFALLGVTITLAGCATNGLSDAKAVPYSVVQTAKPQFFGYPSYSYVDNEGQLHPLGTCERPGMFSRVQCASENGLIQFQFSYSKGRTSSATITVDGVYHSMSCSVNKEDSWSGLYICIPEVSNG